MAGTTRAATTRTTTSGYKKQEVEDGADYGWDEEDGQGRVGTGARTGKDVEDNKDGSGIG